MKLFTSAKHRNAAGFTLVELLVVMAMTGIVMTVIYSMFITQNRSFIVQEQVAHLQQNLRAAMDMMEKDIRLAGYDPTGKAKASILVANPNEIQFQWDANEDGNPVPASGTDPDEQIRYLLVGTELRRESWASTGVLDTVAENIDVLDLVYLDKDNTVAAKLSDICSIQVTLIARTGREDLDYTDSKVYQNLQGTTILDKSGGGADHYRRQLLTTHIKCRNLGLD